MRRKRANISRGMLFTWGMLAGLVFLFAVPREATSRLQLTYASVFRWPLATGRGISLAAHSAPQPQNIDPKEYKSLVANNQQLQIQLANVRAELEDVRKTNERLTKLKEQTGLENMEFRLARVLFPPDRTHDELIINRGTEHGVARGQFVVSVSGQEGVDQSISVLGTVSSVEARTANVRLITDPRSQIVAGIAGLTMRGYMKGRGLGTATISLSAEPKTKRGDPVYALKQPGLDVPIVTGRIADFRRSPEEPVLWEVTVQPVCDVASLGDVAVLIATVGPQ